MKNNQIILLCNYYCVTQSVETHQRGASGSSGGVAVSLMYKEFSGV